MPNSSQSSPQDQQQQQQQEQQQPQQQIIATSGVPITFDGQEATFIPASAHGSLVSTSAFLWFSLWNRWYDTQLRYEPCAGEVSGMWTMRHGVLGKLNAHMLHLACYSFKMPAVQMDWSWRLWFMVCFPVAQLIEQMTSSIGSPDARMRAAPALDIWNFS